MGVTRSSRDANAQPFGKQAPGVSAFGGDDKEQADGQSPTLHSKMAPLTVPCDCSEDRKSVV